MTPTPSTENHVAPIPNQSICIDLTTYQVTFEGDYLVIKDCAGSILSQLEKPARDCWTKHYGAFIDDEWCPIEYDAEEEQCTFRTHEFDAVLQWISDNFYAIDSIGYEVLEDLQ